ncbi:wax ester synthase/diacylglycerol acyltransferase 11-like isoform X1 [Pyrus x bretschneideri]|uniref:wax ester synthase/diacylglycerol acyltransferase 11-like isoform X1 n=1 Tax=Pyrus x bretschneideri TaxID=225117 RepID=UPI00202E38BD|nr:wax ester synthase/diacylglycerol acyltransferase 11-like isoform X1 [Pyrus x bretschneideri]
MGLSAADSSEFNEPLTPLGRFFLQPEMNQIIHCAMGFTNPINIDAVKSHLKTSLLLSHPRFSSLLLRQSNGPQHWHKTTPSVDLDRHIVVINNPVLTTSPSVDHETAVNAYLADLSTTCAGILGTDVDKPLWELHLLMAHNCCVFRIHHALGDGMSLMSLFLASFREVDQKDDEEKGLGGGFVKEVKLVNGEEKNINIPTLPSAGGKRSKRLVGFTGGKRSWVWLLEFVEMLWFNMVFVVEFLMRSLWLSDRKTEISGGSGVELWPRKLATARFGLHDMKLVKKTVPNATINDVLVAVVSSGLSIYLSHQTPKVLSEGLRITGLAMVNLRQQPGMEVSDMMKSSGSSWGNKFGMFHLPIHCHKSSGTDPLECLKRNKVMLDRKKKSVEAHFSNKIACFFMTYFGQKIATWFLYRLVCNASFTISNIVGPQEELALGGNPVTYLRINASSLPQALVMHMVSYVERADLQILVTKDIIPDPAFLAKCFEEALLDMKEAAAAIGRT